MKEQDRLRKYDYIYFVALALIIIFIVFFKIYHDEQVKRILSIEERTIIYLDKELCERVRFLETVSAEFIHSGKLSEQCDAYNKLELKRIIENE